MEDIIEREMDFKSPVNRTKNKFDTLDLDDLGEEVVVVSNGMASAKGP